MTGTSTPRRLKHLGRDIPYPRWNDPMARFRWTGPLATTAPVRSLATWVERRRLPRVEGPDDNADVRFPGGPPVSLPDYYAPNPVHRMPQPGFLDDRIGLRYDEACENFLYAVPQNIAAWIDEHVIEPGLPEPRRVLDIGCGTGQSALVWAALFPNAEVIGIDLSPPMLRWARKKAREQGLENVRFYQLDAADLSVFPDDHFDVVHDTHTLHEMPAGHCARALMEMVRVCTPGGLLPFFDWELPQTEQDWIQRRMMAHVGQEPFMLQYACFDWESVLRDQLGCSVETTPRRYLSWDRQSEGWKATKGPESNRLLGENRQAILDHAQAAARRAAELHALGRPPGPMWGQVADRKPVERFTD